MEFKYKAINTSGKRYTDTAEADSKYDLARQLKERGESLISAADLSDISKSSSMMLKINNFLTRIKTREKVFFARNLSAMISAGLAMSRSLSVVERQTENEHFKQIIQGINSRVQKGHSLSDGLALYPKVFSQLFVSMTRAGEESGQLSESLQTVANQMERSFELKRRVRGAMMYPSIVVTAMFIVGFVLMTFVVPTLTATFKELDVELPGSTRFIIFLSDFLKNNTFWSIGIIIMLVLFVVALWRNPRGRRMFDGIFIKAPLVGELVRETYAATTARTLASLLGSGVEVVTALGITKDVLQNSYYKEVLSEAEDNIQKGKPISLAFLEHEKIYPVLMSEMMSVGEEVGTLHEMLERVADFYEDDVSQRTKDLSTIIEPILMVIIGGVVGFFAVAMITPIYSVGDAI